MEKITTIAEPKLTWNNTHPTRISARGIVYSNNQLLMINSGFYDDYSFPGGGVEGDETLIETLEREVLEEVGVLITCYQEVGFIDEVRFSKIRPGTIFQQRSYYFLCNSFIKLNPNLDEYEKNFDFKPVWVNPIDALNHNLTKSEERKNKTFIDREIVILNMIINQQIPLK